eukprot:914012-Pyramimonas_sp.AAC.1
MFIITILPVGLRKSRWVLNLGLVGAGARGEGDEHRDELLGQMVVQLVRHVHRLARAGVSHAQDVLALHDQTVHHERVRDGVRRGHDDVCERRVGVNLRGGDRRDPVPPGQLVL